MLQLLKDWLNIYTWRELWIIVSVPTAITGIWFLFTFLLGIPNAVVRAVALWSLFLTLSLGAITVDTLRKRQQ